MVTDLRAVFTCASSIWACESVFNIRKDKGGKDSWELSSIRGQRCGLGAPSVVFDVTIGYHLCHFILLQWSENLI